MPIEMVKLSDLQPLNSFGRLTNQQIARISTIANACRDFHDIPMDDWVDSFMRDCRREKEIRLWEGIVDARNRLSTRFRLSPSRRKRLGEALLCHSAGGEIAVDGVPPRAIKTAFANSFKLLRTDNLLRTDLRSYDSLHMYGDQSMRLLAFESKELMDAYFDLVDRRPEWKPVDDEPNAPGVNVCIAVYEHYPEIVPMNL